MKIVEINGIKLEIDERTARTVESYKVGDRIKVLKKSYGSTYNVYTGVIAGFSEFKELPTIDIMFWNGSDFEFAPLNARTEGIEIAPHNELEIRLDKARAIDAMDRKIVKAKQDLDELEVKRTYFIERYAQAFEAKAPVDA